MYLYGDRSRMRCSKLNSKEQQLLLTLHLLTLQPTLDLTQPYHLSVRLTALKTLCTKLCKFMYLLELALCNYLTLFSLRLEAD